MAKVLLVEDDNNLREIYEMRLQAEGYDIASARDGEEALVIAKQVNPDLVISDVMMPKISGFEMLDILRNTEGLKHVKVIMLTALGQSEDQTRADSLGADRYLVKSQVTLEDIVNAAHELLIDAGAIEAPAATPLPAAPAPTPLAQAAPAVAQPMAVAPTPQAVSPEPIVAAPAVAVAPEPVAPASTPAAVIPMAAPPQDEPMQDTSAISMPPTDVSTIPTAELAGYEASAPAVAPLASAPDPTPIVEAAPSVKPMAPAPAVEAVAEPVFAAPAPLEDTPEAVIPVFDETQTQTEAQESASVEAQIDDFVQHQSGQPEPEVTTPEVTIPESTTTPEQEQALADALQSLGGAPEPAAAPSDTSAPEPAPAPVTDATPRKKVIEPLTDNAEAPKKSLDELVAADQAAEQVAAAPTPSTPAPTVTAMPAAAAPAPVAPLPPQQPAMAVAPAPPQQDDFDPNSIAL